jgi:hypothetical protein
MDESLLQDTYIRRRLLLETFRRLSYNLPRAVLDVLMLSKLLLRELAQEERGVSSKALLSMPFAPGGSPQ